MKATWAQMQSFLAIVRHGGITRAAAETGSVASRYSGALKALESAYGCALAVRDPFALTPAGEKLAAAFARTMTDLDAAETDLEAARRPVVRAVASEVIAQNFFSDLAVSLERRHPGVAFDFDSLAEPAMVQRMADKRADCAIAPDHPRWKGFSRAPLLELPLVLLAPASTGLRRAADIWGQSQIEVPLLVPASTPTLVELFETGAKGLRLNWPNRRAVSSVMSVTRSVRAARGVGLSVQFGPLIQQPGVRVLPLENFPRLALAAFWPGAASPEVRSLVDLARETARTVK